MDCTCSSVRWRPLWKKLRVENTEFVADFLVVFARFEYALKRAGYRRTENGKADPNWDKFAEGNGDRFDREHVNQTEEVKYLLNRPPRKEWVEGGKVFFSDRKKYGDEKEGFGKLIDIVKGVRNNLFHGGKFEGRNGEEPGRNAKLIESALWVLERALELDEKVKDAFWHV